MSALTGKMTHAQILPKFSPGSSAQMRFLLWPQRMLQTQVFPTNPKDCIKNLYRILSITKHKGWNFFGGKVHLIPSLESVK